MYQPHVLANYFELSVILMLNSLWSKKRNVSHVHTMNTVCGGIAPLILNLGTRWRWILYPSHFISGKEPCYPSSMLGGSQSQCQCFGEEKIILPLPGFEPHVVKAVTLCFSQLHFHGSLNSLLKLLYLVIFKRIRTVQIAVVSGDSTAFVLQYYVTSLMSIIDVVW